MSRPNIFDGQIERQMTETEHDEWLDHVAEMQERVAVLQATVAAKVSARVKLKALGLTDDEIAALVG